MKTVITDYISIFTISLNHRLDSSRKKVTMGKRVQKVDSIHGFKDILYEVDLGKLHLISDLKDVYEYFLKVFSRIYDLAFPLKTM